LNEYSLRFGIEASFLLNKDQETLSKLSFGTKPQEPVLYDPEILHQHCEGNMSFHAAKAFQCDRIASPLKLILS
jgi:hypothetical protein